MAITCEQTLHGICFILDVHLHSKLLIHTQRRLRLLHRYLFALCPNLSMGMKACVAASLQ